MLRLALKVLTKAILPAGATSAATYVSSARVAPLGVWAVAGPPSGRRERGGARWPLRWLATLAGRGSEVTRTGLALSVDSMPWGAKGRRCHGARPPCHRPLNPSAAAFLASHRRGSGSWSGLEVDLGATAAMGLGGEELTSRRLRCRKLIRAQHPHPHPYLPHPPPRRPPLHHLCAGCQLWPTVVEARAVSTIAPSMSRSRPRCDRSTDPITANLARAVVGIKMAAGRVRDGYLRVLDPIGAGEGLFSPTGLRVRGPELW
ncbi:hypothetical protein E2562_024051 [Oryza meyeriana var. granulata]|uniref:Uncharacterized protein n=1 Tax=Oryza meyeriana var. granulata TaxID=110450 RepID=A0A6G1CSH2_9ORYZ|nr:hypothetical protein E2562_024051 [Oryza meyeriana var. granulata]